MIRTICIAFAFYYVVFPPMPSAKAASVSVAQHVEFMDAVYDYAGLLKIGLKRSTFTSCSGCVPIILYCTTKIRRLSDLRGRKIVARGAAAKFVRTYAKTTPQLLPMGEFKSAFQTGVIHCAATGGSKPKWAINGPRPRSLRNAKLRRSRFTGTPSTGQRPTSMPSVPRPAPKLAKPSKPDNLQSLDDF